MKRLFVASTIAAAAIGVGGIVAAQTIQYRAEPVGEFEVPNPVETSATADFKLKVAADGMSARYDLKIKDPIDDAFMAHLHLGEAGVNGPVVVWLYPHQPPPGASTGEDFTGRLAKDVITPDDLVGPLAGDWDGFLEALEDGTLYVNVHTTENGGGEVRDQVEAHPHG